MRTANLNCPTAIKRVAMRTANQRLLRRSILLCCVSLACLSRQIAAQAGQLDPAFGNKGVFSASSVVSMLTSVALQSDGKIVAAGQINNLPGVLRLNTNGTLDSTFGKGGIATNSFNNNAVGDVAIGLAIQSDGKIVIGGSDAFADNELVFELARFNPDGSPDSTFGNNGTVVTIPFNQALFSPTALALQPDGKILLAGTGVMARYDTNGQLDSTFAMDGVALLVSRSVTGIALQPSGKILIASGGTPFLLASPSTGEIARYDPNGSLDTGFGSAGQAACLPSGTAIVVQGDGKIVVAGTITSRLAVPPAATQTGFGLIRLGVNGGLDTSFGARGAIITGFGSPEPSATANSLALQMNGDVVAAGVAGKIGFNGNQEQPSVFGLARYLTAGSLDSTFGSKGLVTTAFGSSSPLYLRRPSRVMAKLWSWGLATTPSLSPVIWANRSRQFQASRKLIPALQSRWRLLRW